MTAKERILTRWRRGLRFRSDPSWLLFQLRYTDSVDAEGQA